MYTEHVHVILYRVRSKSDQIDILRNSPLPLSHKGLSSYVA